MKKFLKGVRGKQILVSGLAILVLVTGYFRWSADNRSEVATVMNDALPQDAENPKEKEAETNETVAANEDDYFSKARYERDIARSEATELLRVSAENSDSGDSDSLVAAEKIAQYAKYIEAEAIIENLVISKGYEDCVAFVDDSGVKVVVKSDSLEEEGVTKIKDIVIQQTGVKATDIKISGKK